MNKCTVRAAIGSKYKGQDVLLRELDNGGKIAADFNLVDFFPSSWLLNLVSGSKREAERCQLATASAMSEVIEQHRERRASKREGGRSRKI